MGALTLKVFSNELREWELIEGEAVDPTNSFGVNLRLSLRENQIFLAEPYDLVIPWITDKARLFFDGMFKEKENQKKFNWDFFFLNLLELVYFTDHFNYHKKSVLSLILIFENLSLEVLNVLYLLEQSSSIIKIRKSEGYNIKTDLELTYQLNNSVPETKMLKSDLALLLNTNSRYEGYVLNLLLRQRFFKGNFKILSIGSDLDLTFPTLSLGSNFNNLKLIFEGTHSTCQDLSVANSPALIANTEFFKRNDSKLLVDALQKTSTSSQIAINNFSVLNHSLNSVGVNSLNKFLPLSEEDFKKSFGLYFVNVPVKSSSNVKHYIELYLLKLFSNEDYNNRKNNINKILIDQYVDYSNNTWLDSLKTKFYGSYYYLPSKLYLEDSETFINTQGTIKRTTKLLSFKKNAKSSWQIIRKIYLKTKAIKFFTQKKDGNFVNFDAINTFNFKNYFVYHFYAVQVFTSFSFYLTKQNSPHFELKSDIKKTRTKLFGTKLKYWLDDFFTGNGKDSFSYNSFVLMSCSKNLRISSTNFF